MKHEDLQISLFFRATVKDLPEITDLNHAGILLSFGGYSDGRNSFLVEVVEDALRRHLKDAISGAIHNHFYKIHGNEMVRISKTGRRSKACLEAEKVLEGFEVFNVRLQENTGKVERVDDTDCS